MDTDPQKKSQLTTSHALQERPLTDKIHPCMLTIQSSVQHIVPKYDQRAKIPRHLMKASDMKGRCRGGRKNACLERRRKLYKCYEIFRERK